MVFITQPKRLSGLDQNEEEGEVQTLAPSPAQDTVNFTFPHYLVPSEHSGGFPLYTDIFTIKHFKVTLTDNSTVSFSGTLNKVDATNSPSGFPSTFTETMFSLPEPLWPATNLFFDVSAYTSAGDSRTGKIYIDHTTGEVGFSGGMSVALNGGSAHYIHTVELDSVSYSI